MKLVITGAEGFIGKNLSAELKNRKFENICSVTKKTSSEDLEDALKDCDFVFHFAGVNRPENEKEFFEGNTDFTETIVDILKKYDNKCPVLMSSSIQAELDNTYGKSKKQAEDILLNREKNGNGKAYIYRLPNVFGKWSKPNYNSAVATFCYNIARNLDITVNDKSRVMNLVYIDDVMDEFICAMDGNANKIGDYYEVPVSYKVELGKIPELIEGFKNSRKTLEVPNFVSEFEKKLYSTYLSFLDPSNFSYELKMNCDNRGSFTEFIRTPERGQVSVNISKPGITKGNHWHHTKNEKFLVVKGKGLIQFRKVGEEEVIDYPVSGEKLTVVDIPCGYTHNIINVGDEDMVTVMWANEAFNPEKPDTFFEIV